MTGGQQTDLAQAQQAVMVDMQVATTELRAVLDAEREALDQADSIALDAATSVKAQLLQRLESLDAERRQFEELAPAPGACLEVWRHVCRQLEECRRINETNGNIVTRQLSHVRRALGILRGSGEAPSVLYGRGGEARAPAIQHSLSRA
ncbi:MAG: flagella synthesis protein FlgN [Rhodanobacteraceae bacterium]